MKRIILALMITALFHFADGNAVAAAYKVQVAEFTVTGAENSQELKRLVKTLLSSRIATGGIVAVDETVGVIAKITGSYVSFGTTFSLDATVKNAQGEPLGQRYVQGQNQNDLIPAIGRLAEQIRELLPLLRQTAAVPVNTTMAALVSAAPAQPLVADATPPAENVVHIAPGSQTIAQQTRIEGKLIGIAPGRTLPGSVREFVVADATHVYLYHQTESLKKVSEFALKTAGKILTVDTADVDKDGALEVYLTVVDQEELTSVALAVSDVGFTPIAIKLPYFFRAVGVSGKTRQLYAQQAGRGTEDFYGDVCLVVKKGVAYSLGEPIKLPRLAHLFSFNLFEARDGNQLTVYIDRDGELRIADKSGKELWKGAERFGGSEAYFLRDEQQMQNVSMDRYRWRFIEQRIAVTPDGEVIVPRNSGLLSIGNNRSFSKNIVTGFIWNGAGLEERWHTKESLNYLADYFYDAERKEIITLEHTQKEGIFSNGASAVFVKKIK